MRAKSCTEGSNPSPSATFFFFSPLRSVLTIFIFFILSSSALAGHLSLTGRVFVKVYGLGYRQESSGDMPISYEDTFVLKRGFVRGKLFSLTLKGGSLSLSNGITGPGDLYILVPYLFLISKGGGSSMKVRVVFPDGSFSGRFCLERGKLIFSGSYSMRCGFLEEGSVDFYGRVEKGKKMVKLKYKGVVKRMVRFKTGWCFSSDLVYDDMGGSVSW